MEKYLEVIEMLESIKANDLDKEDYEVIEIINRAIQEIENV